MNTPPHHDPQQPDIFLESTQTHPSRPLPASKDTKRVCFYKSGDPQFYGHWVVINSRTFKTFDALLDTLSNKVPLPFGVRTITTPKGTHSIRSLNDLQHGASYVCSDQRKVKPLNLNEINRRHVSWNSTRTTSAERQGRRELIRQLVGKTETGRTAKMSKNLVIVRTPKRLLVYKNRDPSSKRIVVLQRRTAPTYEALLDYLSQVMQFPVVKLYTTDGRRLEGLPALILCSGVIVAAGNEPFQQVNFNLHASTQPSRSAISETVGPTKTQPQVRQSSASSRSRSRNFSLSSERYFVNQINRSLNGSRSEDNEVKKGSLVSVNNKAPESGEMKSELKKRGRVIMPSDDEIKKSFLVNPDGSMTVEMKVRLTIKQEEMIRWTTTVTRACVNSQQMAAFSQPISNYNSSDNKDNSKRKSESNVEGCESNGGNLQIYKPTQLNKEEECQSVISEVFEKPKARFRRLPTPGPRRVRKKETSVENIKRLSQTEVQKSTVGANSYMEHTAERELLEGYCVVSHSSSSSTKPVPKIRKKNLKEAKPNKTHSSFLGTTGVLQPHNKATEITETIMHVHQSSKTCENSFAKTWDGEDAVCGFNSQEHKKPDSTPRSSNSDCDTDLTKTSANSAFRNARNNELLSIISGQSSPSRTMSNNTSSFNDCEIQARCESSEKRDFKNKRVLSKKNLKTTDRCVLLKSSAKDKKQTPDFVKDLRFSESQSCTDKCRQKVTKRNKAQSPVKINAFHSNLLMDRAQSQCDSQKFQMNKKLDIVPSSHSASFIVPTKQRSGNGSFEKSCKVKKCKELSESVSMPVLHSSPCNVHQYVKNWLETIHPESMPYMDSNPHESRARFQIESDFSDVSEMRYEVEENSVPMNKQVSRDFVQIGCEGKPTDAQHLRRSFNSLPSVRILHAPEKKIGTKLNKSLEDLIPKLQHAEGETSANAQLNRRSGMKQVLEQLCLSVKFIRRACGHSHLSSLGKMKKSSSLPDFSSQLASVFGSPSKALLSFLTVMTLRDGIANSSNEDSGSAKDNNSSNNPEALQVMQSIQDLTKIENEEELKFRLVNLLSSTSAQLKRSWRDFQKMNNIKESPPMSPRQPQFALEVNSEEDDQDHFFGINEVMDELNMCEDLRREVSSLVTGDLTHFDELTKEHSGLERENVNVARDNADDSGRFFERETSEENDKRFLEENESQYADITNTEPVLLSTESEELNLVESSPHNPALLSKALESDVLKNLQVEDLTNQKGLVSNKTEHVDDVKTNQEGLLDNAPSSGDLPVKKDEMIDNVQMIDEKNTEHQISQVDPVEVSDDSPGNLKDEAKWQEDVGRESELLSPTSGTNVRLIAEVIYTDCKRGDVTDSLEGRGVNVKEQDVYCETNREHPKQPDVISLASEIETVKARHPNNRTVQTEDAIRSEDRLLVSNFNVNEADPESHYDNDHKDDPEETMSSTSECENPTSELYHFPASDQEDEHKSTSCTWQESESEYELQRSEDEIEKHSYNAKDNVLEAHGNEHFDAEPSSNLQLDQEDKYSDHSGSYKGQEVGTELDLQTLEEESVGKNPHHPADETDEHDDNALLIDTHSHQCSLEDPSTNDFLSWESCTSEEKQKAQQDHAGIGEVDMDGDCHCQHSTMFSQQLLDFLNLALKSSALIFTYDSSGCLQIKADGCKHRAMSLSKSDVVSDNNRRCLLSPNTSDLSDYRPDTSDSGGDPLQVSTDLLTESGEDDAERRFISQSRKAKTLDPFSKKPHSLKQIAHLKISPDSINTSIQDQIDYNSSDSVGNSELAQRPAFDDKPDSGKGILIDKGRWLLKENHLIRNSPPVPMGMYENVDTTSVDTGQENTGDEAPFAPCGRKASPLAAISSSELEDMTKPSTPKCTYFNIVHSSDSDPFSDNQNITSNKGRGFIRKSTEVSPLGETSKTPPKKNGSLPSFTSVDFKLAAGKVHPEDSMASSAVEKSVRSQSLLSNTAHEEEPDEDLSLRCGQHCPIL